MVPGPKGPQIWDASSQDFPKPPLEADAQISEILFREMEVKTTAIVRKVAMTPTVLYGHAWVVNNSYFDGDVGDWVNYCCRLTLEKFRRGTYDDDRQPPHAQ